MATQNLKPPFPETVPRMALTVEAELLCDFDRFSNGFISMGIASAEISSNGKNIDAQWSADNPIPAIEVTNEC